MTDREMLLAAICANPDEDTPRLAFADWLQEQGGKENILRADYIRGAIRLAREELFSPAWQKAKKEWDKVNGPSAAGPALGCTPERPGGCI